MEKRLLSFSLTKEEMEMAGITEDMGQTECNVKLHGYLRRKTVSAETKFGTICAEVDNDGGYPEASIYLKDKDGNIQDIVCVNDKSAHPDMTRSVSAEKELECLVYADENDEDYTNFFGIKPYDFSKDSEVMDKEGTADGVEAEKNSVMTKGDMFKKVFGEDNVSNCYAGYAEYHGPESVRP